MCSNSPCSPFHFGMSLSDEEILKEGMLQVHFWKFSAVNQNPWTSKIILSRQQLYGDILEHRAFCGPSGHILLKAPQIPNYNPTSWCVFCYFVLCCDFALCLSDVSVSLSMWQWMVMPSWTSFRLSSFITYLYNHVKKHNLAVHDYATWLKSQILTLIFDLLSYPQEGSITRIPVQQLIQEWRIVISAFCNFLLYDI